MSSTEDRKHRSGGPGKPAKAGHLEDGKTDNKPGQKQSRPERGAGKGPGRAEHGSRNRQRTS